ncbi:MAG: Crp/Fnr family transcriptional regulator, partial [Acidobacteriota bacterium]
MPLDKITILKGTPLFSGLSDKELAVLSERTFPRHLSPGEVLFSEAEQAQGIYIIAKGSVRAVRESPDGREQVIHVERAIASIAELPVFDDGPYPSTVIAEEDSDLLFIDKNDMKHMCLEYPQIALGALKVLAGRLRRCAQLVEMLSLQPVSQRLAGWLLSEAKL